MLFPAVKSLYNLLAGSLVIQQSLWMRGTAKEENETGGWIKGPWVRFLDLVSGDSNLPEICRSSVERQKGLTTNHSHTQLDPFASKLTLLDMS